MILPIILLVLIQEISISDQWTLILYIVSLIFLLVLVRTAYRFVFIFGLLLFGWLTAEHSNPNFVRHSASGVLVKLEASPKVQKVRDLQLSFQVIDPGSDLQLVKNARLFCQSVSLVDNNANLLEAKQHYLISGQFEPLSLNADNAYERNLILRGYQGKCRINYLAPLRVTNRSAIQRVKDRILFQAVSNNIIDDSQALFLSMSIGFDAQLSLSQIQTFKELGLAHLLVVSGFQVTLIFYFIQVIFLKILLISRWLASHFNLAAWSSCVAIIVSYHYALLVGFDSASTRAVIALVLLVVTKVLDRNVSFQNVILSTFFIDLILNPYCYRQPGSQLTYFALLGIALGHQPGLGTIANLIRVNFCTTISTGIISIIWFNQFYLVTFFANLLIAPIATLVSCQLGFIALILLYFGYHWLFDFCVFLTSYLSEVSKVASELFSRNISSSYLLLGLILLWFFICGYRIVLYYRTCLLRPHLFGSAK